MTDTKTKTRTITLTDRQPVTIREDEWPVIAKADADDDDSNQPGNQPNREWTRQIRVRQHTDGRAIVYGVYEYDTAFQGKAGAAARRGVLLTDASTDEMITAIRQVADELGTAEAEAAIREDMREPKRWREVAQACIADLPAEHI